MSQGQAANEPLDSSRLFALLYEELRTYARSRMARERANHTLQATAVVHEAWLRLGREGRDKDWRSRGHFFGAMARTMRRILVDHARRKAAAIHGGDVVHTPLDHVEIIDGDGANDLIELDDALNALEEVDSQAAQIVTLRYFAGMKTPEIAEHMGVSTSTVDRHWAAARRWLLIELRGDGREWLSSIDSG